MKKHIVVMAVLLLCLGSGAMARTTAPTQSPAGLFDLYQQNRERGIANYITTDFLLLAYSMIRQRDTAMVEEKQILPALTVVLETLDRGVAAGSDAVSLANQDFLGVLTALVHGTDPLEIRAAGKTRAAAELKLVLSATGIAESPLWGYPLDYSQFRPRGAYTSTEQRANYFRAMKYGSAILFAVQPSEATGIDTQLADRLMAQALQLATVLRGDVDGLYAYQQIANALAFRFGRADDLVLGDILAVADANPLDMAAARTMSFDAAEKTGRKPHILGNIVNRDRLEDELSAEDVLVGFRLFPQRFSADSAMFQRLVSPEGGEYSGTTAPFGLAVIGGRPVKGFVSGYELMAGLGSPSAADFIKERGEVKFTGYGQVFAAGKAELVTATGLEELHNTLLTTLMTTASVAKQEAGLTTAMAFWTWQRYINLLYSKQSVTMSAKSLVLEQKRPGARIEEAAEVYQALYKVADAQNQNVGNSAWSAWGDFLGIISRCMEISDRQTRLGELSRGDEDFLNSLDLQLKAMTGARDLPIVVDVHTEPTSGLVVEEAVGYPQAVWEGKNLRGGRLSHFEFKHPLSDRLTNQSWRQMLSSCLSINGPFLLTLRCR